MADPQLLVVGGPPAKRQKVTSTLLTPNDNAAIMMTSEQNRSLLLAACRKGLVKQIETCILTHGVDINDSVEVFKNACYAKSSECLQILINAGYDVEDVGVLPVLHIALSMECIELLEVLLKKIDPNKLICCVPNPSSLNVEYDCNWTPLGFACLLNKTESAKLLIKFGADVNHASNEICPLKIAASLVNTELVEILLQNGADPNCKKCREGSRGSSCILGKLIWKDFHPLSEAYVKFVSEDEQLRCFKVLSNAGADYTGSQGDEYGHNTCLMSAVYNNLVGISRYLIDDLQVDVNQISKRNITALILLCQSIKEKSRLYSEGNDQKFLQILSLLLKSGANVNVNGELPLYEAVMHASTAKQCEGVKLLLQYGANVKKLNLKALYKLIPMEETWELISSLASLDLRNQAAICVRKALIRNSGLPLPNAIMKLNLPKVVQSFMLLNYMDQN